MIDFLFAVGFFIYVLLLPIVPVFVLSYAKRKFTEVKNFPGYTGIYIMIYSLVLPAITFNERYFLDQLSLAFMFFFLGVVAGAMVEHGHQRRNLVDIIVYGTGILFLIALCWLSIPFFGPDLR